MPSALLIRNLNKVYKQGLVALKDISLEVSEGDFFALLGANGAGKSTALSIVSGLINQTEGQVEVFGYDNLKQTALSKMQLGVVPQEFNFNMFEKVLDVLLIQAGFYGVPRALAKERAEYYLGELNLWDKRNDISRSLSGGMKRRLMIARALMHEPKLLLLDEPTVGVDIEMRRSMWEFLQKLNKVGTTIILTTHYLEEAENLCRNIAIINEGKIIHNSSMKELLKQGEQDVFILELTQPLTQTAELHGFKVERLDDCRLKLSLTAEQNLNDVFSQLDQQGINISSISKSDHRLEDIFVQLSQQAAGDEYE